MQVLLRPHDQPQRLKTAEGRIPWPAIKTAELRARPPCADKFDEMTTFVVTKSGGASGCCIRRLHTFHHNGVKVSARSGDPAALYDVLVGFGYTHLAIAPLETAWACPAKFIDKKE